MTTVAIARGTFAVGGSDSSCYALMAEAFAHAAVQPFFPLAHEAPWPDAARTLAPGGFIPSPTRPAAASPICAPGLSLLLAPFYRIGGADGIFVVTPIAAAALVWCAFVVAQYIAGPAAGAAASVLVATSPIVLFQSMQPMSDIVTAALWMAVVAAATLDERKRSWMMGGLSGVAILVRPNLAPLGLLTAVWLLRRSEDRPRQVIGKFGLAALPGVTIAALLNWILYGHPARLGYGNAQDLFSLEHVFANATHYGRAWMETQTPFALLGVAAAFVVPRERRPLVWLGLGLSIATIAVYLFYQPFVEWWYLRFLLPAVVIVTTLGAAVLARLARHPAAVMAVAAVLALLGIQIAAERDAFSLQQLESRFRRTGDYVREKLPPNAVFFTVFDSGSIRFHGRREAVLWDALDPAWLDRAIAWNQSQGREPFIVVERFEEATFRSRFAGSSVLGVLDWPPRVEIHRQIRIYAPVDRVAYMSGKPVPTEYVWP